MDFSPNFKQFTSQIKVALLSLSAVMVTACPSDNSPVLSKAQLQVQPAEIDFGDTDTQRIFDIKNIGQQSLIWMIKEDLTWVVDFQSISGKINGGGETQITVKIDRAKLKDGANSGKMQVTATADNGGQLDGGTKDVSVKAIKPVTPTVRNNPPTDIGLSKSRIAENAPANTIIGTLSTVDADASDSHTYTLASGGSDFRISKDTLYASKSFDYESKNSYNIRIQTSDGKGGSFQKNFTITVTDVNEDSGDCPATMTYNGKTYKAVKIGTQCWLAENLNDSSHTSGSSFCYDQKSSNCAIYGRLYDWAAAVNMASKITGWHLATDAEWDELCEALGGKRESGGHYRDVDTKLKKGGSSGFEALLAGLDLALGGNWFRDLGSHIFFWSASSDGSKRAFSRDMGARPGIVHRGKNDRSLRMSVRLVKDKD